MLGASQERAGDAREPRDVRRAPRRRPARSATPALLGRAALGYAGRWSQLGRVEEDVAALLQEALARAGRPRTRRCARGCSPGSRSSSTTRATPSGGSRCPRRPSRSRAGSATRARSPPASTRATTRCGGPRPCRSGSRSRPSCAGSPRRSATRSSSSRAPAGPSSTCSSWATSTAPTSRSRPRRGSPRRCTARCTSGGRRCSAARGRSSTGASTRPSGSREETLAIGQRGQAENAVHVFAQSMFNIRREQGRLAEVEEAVRGFIAMYPAVPAWRCSLALLQLELGREDAARGGVRRARRGRLRRAPARRAVAHRDHAAGRGLRAGSATRPRRRSSTRCSRPTRGATWSWGARRPATGRRRASSGCSPRCAGRVGARGAALRRRAGDARGDGRAPVRRADAARVGGDGARARRRGRARASGWPRRSCSPTRSGWRRWRRGRARSSRAAVPANVNTSIEGGRGLPRPALWRVVPHTETNTPRSTLEPLPPRPEASLRRYSTLKSPRVPAVAVRPLPQCRS